eukprot:TRINITY_DN15607_c0_g1_i1.p2 TRINITY_DN15607_c0_g1~~TRINITY_DN15607_c0_g1_i1.p2  ORF type:complete len:222 (+),score=19.78 TRINITY_DN15607_c0_g1_i1:960-1625(+)
MLAHRALGRGMPRRRRRHSFDGGRFADRAGAPHGGAVRRPAAGRRADASGGRVVQLRRFKGGERRALPQRLVLHVPPSLGRMTPDVPMLLLRRLLARLLREWAPPRRLLFLYPVLDRAPTAGDRGRAWLMAALVTLGVAPPPVEYHSSYSCRSGGAAALSVCGVSRPGIARLVGHDGNHPAVADAHYLEALAPVSTEAFYFRGRYARTVSPGVAAVLLPPS